MKRSTFFRIFIAMSLIIFISFSLLGGLSTLLSYRRTLSERREAMMVSMHEIAEYIKSHHLENGAGLDDLSFSYSLSMISRVTGFDILLTDTDGVIIVSTDHESSLLGRTIPEEALQEFTLSRLSYMSPAPIILSTLGDIYQTRRPVAFMHLVDDITNQPHSQINCYLFVTSDMTAFRQEWQNFTSAFIFLALSVMLFTFVVLFIASKRQIEPLNEMADAARRFARGDYDARVTVDPGRKDEIGQLTEAFNYMADSIQKSEELRSDFVANLSHELKTPMTVISGFAEGLLDGTIGRDYEDRYLKIISSETKRLSRLVKNMLDVSTLGEADPKVMLDSSFDITEVAALALVSLESRINEKNLTVRTKLPEKSIITRGSKDSITQVLYNLIDNAIKYSPDGESISLELWQQDKRVFISVENRGPVIPPEHLPHIFERFHKVDKSRGIDREGVGLGLYIAKSILDKHNEDIFVTSNDGITKFIFSLTTV